MATDETFSGDIDKLISSFVQCRFVAAPVFGPPMAADAGKLVIAMSGDYRSKKTVAHLMVPGVGRKVLDLGGNIEKGGTSQHLAVTSLSTRPSAPTIKLIGNSMIMGANELLAETLTLGEKSGIGAHTVYDLVKGMFIEGLDTISDKLCRYNACS